MEALVWFSVAILPEIWVVIFHPFVFMLGRICGLVWFSFKAGFEPHDKNIENKFAVKIGFGAK